jgi:hypothetical protein
LSPIATQAASHDFKICLLTKDVRDESSTFGSFIPLTDLPIEVWFTSAWTWWKAGELTTNSSGCLNGILSGIGVPESTQIELRTKLQGTQREIQDNSGNVYYYTHGVKAVTKGGAADFGDIFFDTSATPDFVHGSFLLWDSAKTVLHDYNRKTGTTYPYLPVVIRYPDPNWSYGNANNVRIFKDHLGDLKTLRHELGHNLAANDQATNTGRTGDYCTDYSGGSHPYSTPPYIFVDDAPDPVTKDCGHSDTSYEDPNDAGSEGFAVFVSHLLGDQCNEDPSLKNPLNFDGPNREYNYASALCDAVDTGSDNESVAYKHFYFPAGRSGLSDLGSPPSYDPGLYPVSGSKMYAIAGTTLFESELSSNTLSPTTAISVFPMTSEGYDLQSGHLCFVYFSNLFCSESSSVSTFSKVANPVSSAPKWNDVKIVGNTLYGLLTDGSTQSILRTDYDSSSGWTGVWTPLHSESLSLNPIKRIAIDPSKGRLMVLRGHQIDYCNISGSSGPVPPPMCGSGSLGLMSGSTSLKGYSRGLRRSTLWENPTFIRYYGSDLYVLDDHGVAKVDSRGLSEQIVGVGKDQIFKNNLYRRSLSISQGQAKAFATDGSRSFFIGLIESMDENRKLGNTWAQYRFDDSVPVTEEIYCGQDIVSKPALDVLRIYRGKNFAADAATGLSYIPGLTSSEKSSLENTNWITLAKNQECSWSGATVSNSDLSGANLKGELKGRRDTGPGTPDWDLPPRSQNLSSPSKTGALQAITGAKIESGGSPYRNLSQPTVLEFKK